MQIVPVPERVRAFELDPAMPSGALPIFGEYLDRIGRNAADRRLLSWFFLLFGVAQFFTGAGVVLPVGILALAGSAEAMWWYRAYVGVPETRLKREAFRQVDIAADGLVAAGRTVGVRLPDGRWLRIRLDEPYRLLLAGHRRVWLLGRGPKVFVGFSGVVRVRRGRIFATPPAGAVAVPPATGAGTPRLDPVLTAHRRRIARDLRAAAAFLLVLAGFAVWVRHDFPATGWIAWTCAGGALLTALVAATRSFAYGRPLAADHWTELRAVLDGPVRMGRRGARLSGLTMLADGTVVGFRMVKADPSMAANIATTGRLWIAGIPRPGGATAGVPGYPVLGTVWLG
ncbi:hypothetical protein [Amycolatopsis australiensis]|uniref:Uncharacterized protein n=1 Tax=Amycolatopsis australiensis TaxID=546364 RepID=A0A1K1PW05_9PSEU|nr:hypothetical protein [Amycolatopsis australiensis]SFW51701.1 hypothetical protein SAMN04489730_1084 [Amycolatopsis australiensis]